MRTVVYSAAPITGPTLAAAMRAMPGAGFLNLYGQSEVISTGRPREFHVADGDERDRRRLRSVGLPFPGNQARITAEILRDGWCHTGDIGTVDADGLLYLVDRKKDVIISGGENIYSLEAEECLLTHPAVGAVAVIGVPDDTWGEAVSAVVVTASGCPPDT